MSMNAVTVEGLMNFGLPVRGTGGVRSSRISRGRPEAISFRIKDILARADAEGGAHHVGHAGGSGGMALRLMGYRRRARETP